MYLAVVHYLKKEKNVLILIILQESINTILQFRLPRVRPTDTRSDHDGRLSRRRQVRLAGVGKAFYVHQQIDAHYLLRP